MWPVYARGIADDFLPALGSNPCEIRQTLESIGRQCDAAREAEAEAEADAPSAASPAAFAQNSTNLRVSRYGGPWPTSTSFGSSSPRRLAERRFCAGSGVK